MKKVVSVTFEDYEDVEEFAKRMGLGNVPNLVRYAVKQYQSCSWKKEPRKLVSGADGGKPETKAG